MVWLSYITREFLAQPPCARAAERSLMTLDTLVTFQPAIPTLASDRRLLRNDVFEMLLDRILSGWLAPGARLKDAELTAWLNVSRTPVREALGRLAAVGLVRTAPNRFTLVAPLLAAEVGGAVAVLQRLYPDVIRDALDRFCDEGRLHLALLAGRLERDDDASPVEIFQRVMMVVLEAAQNQVLSETVETVHLRVLRYLYLVPEAAALFSREDVVAFTRELGEHDDAAVARIERILSEFGAQLDAVVAG